MLSSHKSTFLRNNLKGFQKSPQRTKCFLLNSLLYNFSNLLRRMVSSKWSLLMISFLCSISTIKIIVMIIGGNPEKLSKPITFLLKPSSLHNNAQARSPLPLNTPNSQISPGNLLPWSMNHSTVFSNFVVLEKLAIP